MPFLCAPLYLYVLNSLSMNLLGGGCHECKLHLSWRKLDVLKILPAKTVCFKLCLNLWLIPESYICLMYMWGTL